MSPRARALSSSSSGANLTLVPDSNQVIYLHGLAGHPGLSPALEALEDVEIISPVLPGFDGVGGFEAPTDYLGWLVELFDALDDTRALPCPIIGASVGGMLAADLAILRPEAVTKLALINPLGIWDADTPGEDPFAVPAPARTPLLFSGEIPQAFADMFGNRGDAEQVVGKYLVQVAGASLVWPVPDRGLRRRMHRLWHPRMLIWGADDKIAPVALAEKWRIEDTVIIDGAGHLAEWDQPDQVARALQRFLSS